MYYVQEYGAPEWHAVRSFTLRDEYELGGKDEDMEDGDIPVAPAVHPDYLDCVQPPIPDEPYPVYRNDLPGHLLHMTLAEARDSLR